ncbi:MAG: RidA family protein [Candidatus Dormibacteraceae bacterium]
MSERAGERAWTRSVGQVVDGAGVYFSRLSTAGPLSFVAGVATDGVGGVAEGARVAPPYVVSPAAHVVAQTKYILDHYADLLRPLGSDLNDLVQVEQWIPHKNLADGYLDTSLGKGYRDRGRATSALLVPGDLMPEGAVICAMGIGVLPGYGISKEIPPATPGFQESMTLQQFGETYQEEGPFNEVIAVGPYVFTVGDQVMNWKTGMIEDSVRLPDWSWWGSAIRNETDFLLTRLGSYFQRAGSDLANVVHSTVYLLDGADLFELDRVWKKRFPVDPPARSVIPVRALGIPRRELPHLKDLRHFEGAVSMEHLSMGIRPGHGVKREVISTGHPTPLHESEGIKAGHLLWISGQVAAGANGVATSSDIDAQVDYALGRIAEICSAAGTSLDNLVRLRGFVTHPADAYAIYAGLKRAVPRNPPTVGITGIEALPYPGCRVMLDAVGFVP